MQFSDMLGCWLELLDIVKLGKLHHQYIFAPTILKLATSILKGYINFEVRLSSIELSIKGYITNNI